MSVTAEGVQIFTLPPSSAEAFAVPMQGFLQDTLTGLYVHELGRDMIVHADPTDLAPGGKVDKQRERIAASGDLSERDQAAYVVAVDTDSEAHGGLVGLAKLSRVDAGTVEIEEVDVALGRRGEGIGPRMLEHALGTLAIPAGHLLTLDVLEPNAAGRKFWQDVGFHYTGKRYHHDYAFPNPADYHLEMSAPVHRVWVRLRERLRPSA